MLDFWSRDKSVIGKPLIEALPEFTGQPFPDILRHVYETGVAYEAKEARSRLMVNGKPDDFYFSFICKPLQDGSGKTTAILHTATDVTELVENRLRISETQERLEFALFSSGVGTWDLDPINDSVSWDARCRELFGFSREGEIRYEDMLSCIHSEDVPLVNQAVMSAIDPATAGLYDIRYRTIGQTDRQVRWVHCKGRAYFNTDNVAYRFAGTAQDITADVEARRREQQLLSLVSGNADMMSAYDMNGIPIYMNEAGLKLIGLTRAELASSSMFSYHSEESTTLIQQEIIPGLLSSGAWSGTLDLLQIKTGEAIPIHMQLFIIRDDISNEPVAFAGIARDLRPERQAQKALSDKNAALNRTIREMEFLANSVPTVVWTSTPDGMLDFINQRWYDTSARSIEETLGIRWAETVHPDDRARAWAAWSASLESGEPYEVEFRVIDRHGDYRWYLVRALPLIDENGTIVKWYGTNTDVQEQKELQRQKDNFLAVASHELKTPVTSIKAYAQVMQTLFDKAGDDRNAAMISKLVNQVNRLNNLIGDLLDVTKINTGRLEFNPTEFDFNELLDEIVEGVQHTSHRHRIVCRAGFKRTILGDKERIGQVITNLLTNALKYSPEANEVIVYTSEKNHTVRLCVQDFGIGISAEMKDKVFEQFYRISGEKQRTIPGLGLGLYISAEIVKHLGGKIWVNSVEGEGSTFCFEIPVLQETAESGTA